MISKAKDKLSTIAEWAAVTFANHHVERGGLYGARDEIAICNNAKALQLHESTDTFIITFKGAVSGLTGHTQCNALSWVYINFCLQAPTITIHLPQSRRQEQDAFHITQLVVPSANSIGGQKHK